MKPSDQDLNKAAATLCGWTNIHDYAFTPTGKSMCGTRPGATDEAWMAGRTYIPRYCTDRNALPELISAVTLAGHGQEFAYLLPVYDADDGDGWLIALRAVSLIPRQIVSAALKACGAWRDDWEDEA